MDRKRQLDEHEVPLAEPVRLDYAGEREADLYRRRFHRAVAVAGVFGVILLLVGGWLTYQQATKLTAAPSARGTVRLNRTVLMPPRTGSTRPTPLRMLSIPQQLERLGSSNNPVHNRAADEWRAWQSGMPAGQLVYEEHPSTAAALRRTPEYQAIRRWLADDAEERGTLDFAPPVFKRWPPNDARLGSSKDYALLFLGQRETPSGSPRLLRVSLATSVSRPSKPVQTETGNPMYRSDDTTAFRRQLAWDLWTVQQRPMGKFTSLGREASYHVVQSSLPIRAIGATEGIVVRHEDDDMSAVRFFSGAPDPNDPSRFEIPYEIGPPASPWHRGRIKGRLLDNDTVELVPTTGYVQDDIWTLPNPPASPQ